MEDKTTRIVLAGGGTGGHLYPALAVADELKRRRPAADIGFVGARRGLEQRLVPQAGYPLMTLSLGGLKGASLLGKLQSGFAAGWAVMRCLAWMVRRRPRLVIGVGGYASGPAVLAAGLLRVKTMVMEQNHFPGATNRWLAPRVDAVCVPSDAAAEHLRGRKFVTGNPVRAEFFEVGERPEGGAPTLLVFGGSRGARSINRALSDALEQLAKISPPIEIVHQTGPADEAATRQAYRRYPEGRSEVHAFLDDMPARFERADMIVCRSGASTLGELCAAARPSILIPYPFAADDHQRRNAEVLEQAGAAIVIRDSELDGPRLATAVARLACDPARRRAMARAARELAQPGAAQRIADVAEGLIENRLVEVTRVS